MKMKSLKIWTAVATGIVFTSLMAPIAGANKTSLPKTGVDGANQYSCTSDCVNQYNYCIASGKAQSYCYNQYQICVLNCMGGAARAGSEDS